MTEEFTIQCQSCGTFYNDLQEVCPYCGQPQPSPIEEMPLSPEEYALQSETKTPEYQDDAFFEDEIETAGSASPSQAVPLPVPTHQLMGLTRPPANEVIPEDEYFYDDAPPAEHPFAHDDIFAMAEEEVVADEFGQLDDYDQYPEPDEFEEDFVPYDQPVIDPFGAYVESEDPFAEEIYYPDDESVEAPAPHQRFTFRRVLAGCLGIFICFGLFYGGIGMLAVRQGLQERAQNTQTETVQHYQKGQEYLANNSVELAIAEFERALSLNPNFLEARQALREAQRIALTQPTPTSQTRSAAATEFLTQAETYITQQNWSDAIQSLLQVRGVDPDYQPDRVSELLHTAYTQLGLEFIDAEQLDEAKSAFEQALLERPDDPDTSVELSKISLYLDGVTAEQENLEKAVELLDQLYELDKNFLDTQQHLWRARELFGDQLAQAGEWCTAQRQYLEASTIQSSDTLEIKAQNAGKNCAGDSSASAITPTVTRSPITVQTTPVPPTPPPTEAVSAAGEEETAQAQTAGPASGRIYYSMYNPNESRWEIVSIPATGGEPEVVVTDATMPAVSPNGQLLLYRTELIDTEGFHIFDLTSGEDNRITKIRDHILPRWGGSDDRFLFTAQEAGTGRWQIYQGFADGKSDPIIFGDGRTPDWSVKSNYVAFQGTDAEGNNPGIYLIPLNGGESTRITNHESDRSPVFSPDGSKLAYMSASSGNWDIYVINTSGTTPRQITSSPGNDGQPIWSPDGTRLAYVSDADGSWAIYVVDAAGGTPIKVADWDASRREDWLTTQIWWAQ